MLEENAYWDFRALVVNDTQTLSLKDALLFLRVLHGDNFSTTHWETFMVGICLYLILIEGIATHPTLLVCLAM